MTAALPAIRSGPTAWLRAYVSMLRFEVTGQRFLHAILFGVQLTLGAVTSLVYGWYLGGGPAAFVVAGVAASALIPLGFVTVPVLVAYRRAEGSGEFMWSLPVPRSAAVAATLSASTMMALPGAVLVLALAVWRFGAGLEVRLAGGGGIVLAALTIASTGYAVAQALPRRALGPFNNLVIVLVLLFAPAAAPLHRVPGWLEWLPFHHLAVVVRHGLLAGAQDAGRSYLALAGWTVLSWLVAMVVVRRRS